MKYLLILLVILVVVWLLRSSARRGARGDAARPSGGGTKKVQRMVECAHCGVHLPASEAVMGGDGVAYCCEAHRLAGPP